MASWVLKSTKIARSLGLRPGTQWGSLQTTVLLQPPWLVGRGISPPQEPSPSGPYGPGSFGSSGLELACPRFWTILTPLGSWVNECYFTNGSRSRCDQYITKLLIEQQGRCKGVTQSSCPIIAGIELVPAGEKNSKEMSRR